MKLRMTIVSLCLAVAVRADDIAQAGRKALKAHEDAVLTLKLVLDQSMSMGGRQSQKREAKSEVTGTVIGKSGLIVVALSATDPTAAMAAMLGGEEAEGRVKFETSISDIRIVLPSGREVPGKVVLRDKDLDLAFVMPAENGKEKWNPVDLSAGARPELLDEVIVLNRLGQVAGRSASVSIGRITTLVEKPRTYYVMDHDMASLGLGSPVFGANGKLIGILAIRTAISQSSMSMNAMFSGASSMGLLPVIVPADQVKEVADQAPEKASETVSKPATDEDPAVEEASEPVAP